MNNKQQAKNVFDSFSKEEFGELLNGNGVTEFEIIDNMKEDYLKKTFARQDLLFSEDYFDVPLIWNCVFEFLLTDEACLNFSIIANRYIALKGDGVRDSFEKFMEATPDIKLSEGVLRRTWKFNILCAIIYDAKWKNDLVAREYIRFLYSTYHKDLYNITKKYSSISSEIGNAIIHADDSSINVLIAVIGTLTLIGMEFDNPYTDCMYRGFVIQHSELFELEEDPPAIRRDKEDVDDWFAAFLTALDEPEVNSIIEERNHQLSVFTNNIFHAYEYDDIKKLEDGESLPESIELYPFELDDVDVTDIHANGWWLMMMKTLIKRQKKMDVDVVSLLFDTSIDFGNDNIQVKYIRNRLDEINAREERRKSTEKRDTIVKIDSSKEIKQEEFDKLEKQIFELKMQLSDKKSMVSSQAGQIQELKKKLKEQEQQIKDAEALQAAFDSLEDSFNSLSNVQQNDSVSIDDMKTYIAQKKLCIIGGHINFIHKLRQMFPNWVVIEATDYKLDNYDSVKKSEYVFFFTDHMGHVTYKAYIGKLRKDNKKNFAYIHSLNEERLIRDIYAIVSNVEE